MTKEGLDSIQLQFKIRLPGNYYAFMTNFPTSSSIIGEVFDNNNFCNDPKRLVDLNLLLSTKSKTLLQKMFCIGENGGGDYYFINLLNSNDHKVYFLDHEEMPDGAFDPNNDRWNWALFDTIPDLNTHAVEILSTYGDPNELISSSDSNSEQFKNEMLDLRKELFGR
jgi:hypothetical protein